MSANFIALVAYAEKCQKLLESIVVLRNQRNIEESTLLFLQESDKSEFVNDDLDSCEQRLQEIDSSLATLLEEAHDLVAEETDLLYHC